jgi:hypothetical protein
MHPLIGTRWPGQEAGGNQRERPSARPLPVEIDRSLRKREYDERQADVGPNGGRVPDTSGIHRATRSRSSQTPHSTRTDHDERAALRLPRAGRCQGYSTAPGGSSTATSGGRLPRGGTERGRERTGVVRGFRSGVTTVPVL